MKNPIIKTGVQYGIQVASGLIIYFITMKIFNLSQHMGLRFFNILIVIFGVYYSIKSYQKTHQKKEDDYLDGVGVGLSTVFVSTVLFSMFMYIYMAFINPNFIEIIRLHSFGEIMNIYIITFSIFIEGLGFGAIATFISMQWLKTAHIGSTKHI